MTAITFSTTPRLASKLHGFSTIMSGALNAYVAYRVRIAVPEKLRSSEICSRN